MKKFILIAMSLLLILSFSNIAFAKNFVQLDVSYTGDFYNEFGNNGNRDSEIYIGLTGEMSIIKAFSLNANAGVILNKNTTLTQGNVSNKNILVSLDATLIGKYYVVNSDIFELALGSEINYLKPFYDDPDITSNYFLLSLGVYGSVNISSKLGLYGSISLPMANLSWGQDNTNDKFAYGSFSFSPPVIVLGAKYSIFSNFYIGLEFSSMNIAQTGVAMALVRASKLYSAKLMFGMNF